MATEEQKNKAKNNENKDDENKVKASKDGLELLINSYLSLKKDYVNDPKKYEQEIIDEPELKNHPRFTNKVFVEIIKTRTDSLITSKTPWQSLKKGIPIRKENFIALCKDVFDLNPEEVIDPADLHKIRTEPQYTPQTKSLDELKQRKRFAKLIGRDAEQKEIRDNLEKTENNQIIVVEGIGGVGKTSLVANSIFEYCEDNIEYATKVIWLTAKHYDFTGSTIEELKPAEISFENVLNEVAVKINKGAAIEVRPTIEQKKEFLINELGNEKYLIVIDNLETVTNFRDLVKNLENLFVYSKVLITTRSSVDDSCYIHNINIKGFSDLKYSTQFIEQFIEKKDTAKKLISGNTQIITDIHNKTGGIPLAMELIICQIESGLPIFHVLDKLSSTNYQDLFEGEKRVSDEDIFNQFYSFIYEESWKLLSDNEKQILFNIAAEPLDSGHYERDLKRNAQDIDSLVTSIKKLKQLNLIYAGNIDEEISYFLHPLTHQFINTK